MGGVTCLMSEGERVSRWKEKGEGGREIKRTGKSETRIRSRRQPDTNPRPPRQLKHLALPIVALVQLRHGEVTQYGARVVGGGRIEEGDFCALDDYDRGVGLVVGLEGPG